MQDLDGKYYFEFDLNKTVAGQDGRVESELNDGAHDDLSGTALADSTFTFCISTQKASYVDADFSMHFGNVKLYSQCAAHPTTHDL